MENSMKETNKFMTTQGSIEFLIKALGKDEAIAGLLGLGDFDSALILIQSNPKPTFNYKRGESGRLK